MISFVCSWVGCRVPYLNHEGLSVVGQPVALWVGVLHSEQHVLVGTSCPLQHSLDPQWQSLTMLLQNVATSTCHSWIAQVPCGFVHFGSFIHVLLCYHLAQQPPLYDVLKSKEGDLPKPAPSWLEIGVDNLCTRRILHMVGDLIGVSNRALKIL